MTNEEREKWKESMRLKLQIDVTGFLRSELKSIKAKEADEVTRLKEMLPEEAPEEPIEGVQYQVKVTDAVVREPDKELLLDYFLGELSEETRQLIKSRMLPVVTFKMEELKRVIPLNKIDNYVKITGTTRRLSFDTK